MLITLSYTSYGIGYKKGKLAVRGLVPHYIDRGIITLSILELSLLEPCQIKHILFLKKQEALWLEQLVGG